MPRHPLVHAAARRKATLAIMETEKVNRFAARRRLNDVTDDQIDAVIQEKCVAFGIVPPSTEGRGAIGDGTIIQGIKEFCEAHPELISAIVKALLLLVGI